MNQFVNMVLRMLMRRMVGRGSNRGIRGNKPRGGVSSGQLRRGVRMIRRMGRF